MTLTALFLKLLNMSITAGWLILAVIAARFLLKKAPRWVFCAFWGLVSLRLILPFSFESALSLIPSKETVPYNITASRAPVINSGIPAVNTAVNPIISNSFAPKPADSANPLQVILAVTTVVWLVGIGVMLLYALISYLRLKRTVRASVDIGDGIMACDDVKSPFILGVIRPKIYVPSSLDKESLRHVVAHEKAHLKRLDHLWKPLGYVLLAVYWFNPLCWIAYSLLCRDIESACDEKVIKSMDKESVAAYSEALLCCSAPQKRITVCPLAFGEVGVKSRVKNVLNYKKPAFWVILIALILSVALVVFLMTDPTSKKTELTDKLKVSLDMAIAEKYDTAHNTEVAFSVCDADVLLVEEKGDRSTVYAWVLYRTYEKRDGKIEVKSGSHVPSAVTFDTSDNGDVSSYKCVEYWEPRDGSYFSEDIRSKFPSSIVNDALSAPNSEKQQENCLKAAQEYFGLNIGLPTSSGAVKWFDSHNGTDNASREGFSVEEYPQVYFNAGKDQIVAISGDKYEKLIEGSSDILCAYFCDVNGDGYRELVAETVDAGTGHNCISIYDRVAGHVYTLLGDDLHTVDLYLQGETLNAEMKNTGTGDTVAKGKLRLTGLGIQIENDGGSTLLLPDSFRGGVFSSGPYSVKVLSDLPSYVAYAGPTDHPDFKTVGGLNLPVFRIDSANELEQFEDRYKGAVEFDRGYGEVTSFKEATKGDGDSFFTYNSLIVVYVRAVSGSDRYAFQSLHISSDPDVKTASVFVRQTENPVDKTDDEVGWFIIAEVKKESLKGIERLYAADMTHPGLYSSFLIPSPEPIDKKKTDLNPPY